MKVIIHVRPEWREAAAAVSTGRKIAMIVGTTDSGKSTLSEYLIRHISHGRRTTALIDCDVGQTNLGVPTTMGMMVYTEPVIHVDTLRPRFLRFIGSTSPVGHLPEITAGAGMLMDYALSSGARTIVVNTGGLVQGPLGIMFKTEKVKVLRPTHLLALQVSSELEDLLQRLERDHRISVLRLPVSPFAQRRTQEARKALRESRYRAYFKGATVGTLSLSEVRLEGTGRGDLPEADRVRYLISGLCDREGNTAAVGIIQDLNAENRTLRVLSPVSSSGLRRIGRVKIGRVRILPDGREEGPE